jgi:hypothetical protein
MTVTRSNCKKTRHDDNKLKVIKKPYKQSHKKSSTRYVKNNNTKTNILSILESLFKVNNKGISELICIDEKSLHKKGCKPFEISMFQSKNGVAYLRRDSPICRKYLVERSYNKATGSLIGFKLVGFNKSQYYSRHISKNIRKKVLEKYGFKCIWCGSKDRLEVDHKNGRYNKKTEVISDFQILCKSCNDKKRQRCMKCRESNCRYNVQQEISSLLYKSAFTSGTGKYTEKQGCKGCFLYDIEDFYMKHDSCNRKKDCLSKIVSLLPKQ